LPFDLQKVISSVFEMKHWQENVQKRVDLPSLERSPRDRQVVSLAHFVSGMSREPWQKVE
jgi:hypothetical protein